MAKVLLAGIGGYGNNYVEEIKKNPSGIDLCGVVDPFAEKAPGYDWIKSQNITIYNTIEEYFESETTDLTVISTPVPFHKAQTIYALSKGSNVLCEKPAAATIQDAEEMLAASEKYGKICAIGFNWSFMKPILDLKGDILNGVFGKLLEVKSFVSWKRYLSYYNHTWKGRLKAQDGSWLLDSAITNATAHYLHNILFLTGQSMNTASIPVKVKAETYRIKPDMESPDLFVLRGILPGNAHFWFATSYSLSGDETTQFEYEFENASITFNTFDCDNIIRVQFKDGRSAEYGNPMTPAIQLTKFHTLVSAVNREDIEIPCTIKTAIPQIKVTNSIFANCECKPVDAKYLENDIKNPGVFAHTLHDNLLRAMEAGKLPSELRYPWAGNACEFYPDDMNFFSKIK